MSSSSAPDDFLALTPEELEPGKRAAKAKRVRDSYLKDLMGSYGGRFHTWSLLVKSHQFEPLAVNDPSLLQRRVGVRDFGLDLMRDLRRTCPDLLALAEREANDRAK